MAGQIRTEDPDVTLQGPTPGNEVLDDLNAEPWTFSLFQAVRLLERALPERSPVGTFAEPRADVVRFRQHPSLSFPASEIQALQWSGPRADITVNAASLVGPLGVMPLYYTELVMDRLRRRDDTFLEFLNIFHHRVTSEFYRAWKKHRLEVSYESESGGLFTERLYDLIGIGTAHLRDRQSIPDEVFAFYSGFYGGIPRSQSALESVLADYFKVAVSVEQFVGVWRKIEVADQSCFEYEFSDTLSLGSGAVLGDEIWDCQSRVRIVMGPLTAERYRDFLPDGSAYQPLRTLLRMFTGEDIEYELQLVLKREDVPACELGAPDGAGIRLGWFTWIKSRPAFDRDPKDTTLLIA